MLIINASDSLMILKLATTLELLRAAPAAAARPGGPRLPIYIYIYIYIHITVIITFI